MFAPFSSGTFFNLWAFDIYEFYYFALAKRIEIHSECCSGLAVCRTYHLYVSLLLVFFYLFLWMFRSSTVNNRFSVQIFTIVFIIMKGHQSVNQIYTHTHNNNTRWYAGMDWMFLSAGQKKSSRLPRNIQRNK